MVVIAGETRFLQRGQRDARADIDKLYRRHSGEVLRYATLVLRSRPDAEDVVQATFIRALRAIARGERVQKPRNWLIAIAHNECRRAFQQRSRRAVEVELEEVPFEPAEGGRAEQLRRAMSQLADKQREALVLRELEGRTYAEIATALELSEPAVETLIFRARKALREQLEDGIACEQAVALVAAESVTPEERKRLRGHLRGCAECASLERQARGRKSALRRIASGFGLPGGFVPWFGKVAAIALTVSAVTVVAAPAERSSPAPRDVTPLQVDKPAVGSEPTRLPAAGATRTVRALRPADHPAPVGLPAAAAAGNAERVGGLARRTEQEPATGAVAAADAPVLTVEAAAPAPVAAKPPAAAGPAATLPPVPVPAAPIQVPPVAVPPVDAPVVVPPVSVTVPPVTVPAVAALPIPVPTPQVSVLPSVP